jgi:hypothetical protein
MRTQPSGAPTIIAQAQELGASSVVGVLSGLQASRVRSLGGTNIETVFSVSSIKKYRGVLPPLVSFFIIAQAVVRRDP